MKQSRVARKLSLVLIPVLLVLLYGGFHLSAHTAQKTTEQAIIGRQADGTYFVPT